MKQRIVRHMALARHHVAVAEQQVVNQYQHIRKLEAAGANTAPDRRLLESLERRLLNARAHLAVQEYKRDLGEQGSVAYR